MSHDTTGADTRTDTRTDRLDVVATMRAAEAQSTAWLASIDTGTETGKATYLLAVRAHAGIVNVLSLVADDGAIDRAILDADDSLLAGGRYCFSGICGECTGCTRLAWPYSTVPVNELATAAPAPPRGAISEADAMRTELLNPNTPAGHFEARGVRIVRTMVLDEGPDLWILKVDATHAVVQAVLDEEHITPIGVNPTGRLGIEVTGGYVSMSKLRDVLMARGYTTTLISKPES